MWHPKGHSTTSSKKGCDNGLVAVAIDKDKGSPHAVKWAVGHLLSENQTVVLIHVVHKSSSMVPAPSNGNGNGNAANGNGSGNGSGSGSGSETSCTTANKQLVDKITKELFSGSETSCTTANKQLVDKITKELFLTYHCFCTRKDMHCLDVILEDSDVVKALTDYVSYAAIDKLVLGAPARSGFMRKFRPDIASCVAKAAPDFCSVYVISKQKVSSIRNATRSAPHTSPLLDQINNSSSKAKRKIPTPTPQELISHYQTQGLDSQEASIKVIEDLQNVVARVVSSNSKPKKDKFLIEALREIDSVNNRLAFVGMKLDTKPGYLETFAIGVASGAAITITLTMVVLNNAYKMSY